MIQVLSLLWIFFKIGACTFGGGYAMVELVAEQVTSHGWMEMQEIIDFIAISESTPGPIAINMATYVGFNVAGISRRCCGNNGRGASFPDSYNDNSAVLQKVYCKPLRCGCYAGITSCGYRPYIRGDGIYRN